VNYRTTDGLVKQALFAINLLNANDTATMRLTFDVTNYVQVAPANPAEYVIPKTVPAAMRKYLGPSPLIESTNIKFKNLAKDVTEGKETAWEQVVAIADRVHEKVKFERDRSKMKGAAVALTDGKGDREDVIGVFVAACRAHKIPARMVWIPDSCYAEFYLENAAGEGHWFPCQLVGDKEVGFLTERKPILQKGDNIRVPEQKDAQRFVPEFLTGKGKSGGRPDVEFVRRLEGQP
jgi:transglutaminase-like putative cysteine protease